MSQPRWIDYYALLELYDPINQTGKGPDSTAEEIKQAWKFQLNAWHPDKFRGKQKQRANERTQLINEAYKDVLSKPDKKKVYDAEWRQKNSWFRSEQESKSTVPPAVAVSWDPPDVFANLFYNIPRGEKRTAKLIIHRREGQGFSVKIEEPSSGWLKVLEPRDKRGIPDFTAVIEVDTTNLQPNHEYNDELVLVLEYS